MNETKTDIVIPDILPELERGPKWLRDRRHASRKAFNAAPVPERGLHLWRYTDPHKFLYDRDSATYTAYDENHDAIESTDLPDLKGGLISGLVTDLGGREINVHGSANLAKRGIIVTTLSQAVETHHALVERYLYGLVNSQTGKFEALNGALWNDGIFVYVPDGKRLAKPLYLLREAGSAGSVQFPRLLIVVGKNAELTVIDEYGGGSDNMDEGVSHTNGAVEIFALEDSRVQYVALQRQASAVNLYLTHRARIAAGASMLTIPLAFGALVSKLSFGAIMDGPGAQSDIRGLVFGSKRQHFDSHTLQYHRAGRTTSDIDFKVVLRDRAVSAYTGLIRIDNDARDCEAYQENRNLLLNRGARANTIPELEILNEDVQCSHGATIGPIDPDSIFYLEARGIRRDQAVRMIVSGFVDSTLKQVPEDLRQRIAAFVRQRLEHR